MWLTVAITIMQQLVSGCFFFHVFLTSTFKWTLGPTEYLLDPGNLDHPSHVGGVDLMLDEPCC